MTVVITKKGLAKIARATVENPLVLTKFAVGDGNGKAIEPNESMDALLNEKYRASLNSQYASENNLTIECVIGATAPIEKEFDINELGIFDEDDDMIAITSIPSQHRPASGDNISTEWIASVVLQLQNTSHVEIKIVDSIYITTNQHQILESKVKDLVEDLSNSLAKHDNLESKVKDLTPLFNQTKSNLSTLSSKHDNLESKVKNLSSVTIPIERNDNFSKNNNVQEALDSLYNRTQDIMNRNREFYNTLIGVPIILWTRDKERIIKNKLFEYILCDGEILFIPKYRELYRVIGDPNRKEYFELPDTRESDEKNMSGCGTYIIARVLI